MSDQITPVPQWVRQYGIVPVSLLAPEMLFSVPGTSVFRVVETKTGNCGHVGVTYLNLNGETDTAVLPRPTFR